MRFYLKHAIESVVKDEVLEEIDCHCVMLSALYTNMSHQQLNTGLWRLSDFPVFAKNILNSNRASIRYDRTIYCFEKETLRNNLFAYEQKLSAWE